MRLLHMRFLRNRILSSNLNIPKHMLYISSPDAVEDLAWPVQIKPSGKSGTVRASLLSQ
uniref:Uncharacterized protein n=1 Tax=Arundo donax TaxID=35708 RepID=A0A0A9NRS6_ARUDO